MILTCKKLTYSLSFALLLSAGFSFPSDTHAEWTVNYDNSGGVQAVSDIVPYIYFPDFTKNNGFDTWEGDNGFLEGQDAIDWAYLGDPSQLPFFTEWGFVTPDGLSWPCGWSQFSEHYEDPEACVPPELPSYSAFSLASSTAQADIGFVTMYVFAFVIALLAFFMVKLFTFFKW